MMRMIFLEGYGNLFFLYFLIGVFRIDHFLQQIINIRLEIFISKFFFLY